MKVDGVPYSKKLVYLMIFYLKFLFRMVMIQNSLTIKKMTIDTRRVNIVQKKDWEDIMNIKMEDMEETQVDMIEVEANIQIENLVEEVVDIKMEDFLQVVADIKIKEEV